MYDNILYNYIQSAIIYNLDYDQDKYAILACDTQDIDFYLDNNIFIGYCYLVLDKDFQVLGKELLKQNKEINKENTKELARIRLGFTIDSTKVMNSLYDMTGL